jgi:hypothetical protein
MNIGEPERETLRNTVKILKNEAKLITSKFTLFTALPKREVQVYFIIMRF